MTTEQNKAIVRRMFEEIINQERAGVSDEIYAVDAQVHDPFMGDQQGVEAFRQLLGMVDVRSGKIVEVWRKDDDVSLMMRLGMIPMPQPA